jgi:hypothetical protein
MKNLSHGNIFDLAIMTGGFGLDAVSSGFFNSYIILHGKLTAFLLISAVVSYFIGTFLKKTRLHVRLIEKKRNIDTIPLFISILIGGSRVLLWFLFPTILIFCLIYLDLFSSIYKENRNLAELLIVVSYLAALAAGFFLTWIVIKVTNPLKGTYAEGSKYKVLEVDVNPETLQKSRLNSRFIEFTGNLFLYYTMFMLMNCADAWISSMFSSGAKNCHGVIDCLTTYLGILLFFLWIYVPPRILFLIEEEKSSSVAFTILLAMLPYVIL